jgi:signal transduction histidine kinase
MRLLTKLWISTSLAITLLFGATGWMMSQHLVSQSMNQLTAEVANSLQAFRTLWRERAQALQMLSGQIARAPQVRAAFSTGDAATIADTSAELLRSLESHLGERGLVIVTDPRGRVIARLAAGGLPPTVGELGFVDQVRDRFPAQQSGFGLLEEHLYQFVVTPVYVQSGAGLALINVLVTGFEVTDAVAQQLRLSTGSDFVFFSAGRLLASTLGGEAGRLLLPLLGRHQAGQPARLSAGELEFIELSEPLTDLQGRTVGTLAILRTMEAAAAGAQSLRKQVALIWAAGLILTSVITFILARTIIRPIEALDHAAAEVARENYAYRVEPKSNDEIGRLARTFNKMCASIQHARDELIRNERLYTIGRLTSSIVHDLRNPLAAIYGSSEMLLHADLPAHQQKRLLANLHKASRKIQGMLEDLLKISRGKTAETREERPVQEILRAAAEPWREAAENQRVEIALEAPEDAVIAADPSRLERAFGNLLANALEVMPAGGRVELRAITENGSVLVSVKDTGPGIPPEVRERLFEPFASAGKRSGTGLGLALARQTVLDHGGDMWAESEPGRGATFFIRLPLLQPVGEAVSRLGPAGSAHQSVG